MEMEEEQELSLLQDRFEDLSVDDQPIDVESSFDEEEIKSQIEEEAEEEFEPTKNQTSKQRQRSRRPMYEQLPTICEANESRTNLSVVNIDPNNGKSNEKQIQNDSWTGLYKNLSAGNEENSNDFSMQFQNGKAAIEKYTEEFFSEKNKANVLFPENDYRFETNKFEKENSWEPSIVDYGNQPTPETKIKENNSTNLPNSNENLIFKKSIIRNSPEKETIFKGSPIINQSNVDTKTSTPKRPPGTRTSLNPKFPQLNISEISSIYPGSPTNGNTIGKNTTCNNSTLVDPWNKTEINNIIKKNKEQRNIYSILEEARKKRNSNSINSTLFDFRRNSSINRSESITATALENSKYESKQCDISNQNISSRINKIQLNNLNQQNKDFSRTESRSGRESINTRCESRVSTTSVTSSISNDKKRNPLKINRKRLGFGMIDIGDSIQLDVEIENVSDRTCRINCSTDSKSQVFIIAENGVSILNPHEKTQIKVSFRPEKAGRYHVFLLISIHATNIHYKIPMWGCGGMAKIEPIINNDLRLSNTNHFILRTSNFSTISFKLKNEGIRDGFARIDVFDAMLKPIDVNIRPARGIILRRKNEKTIEIQFRQAIPSFSENRTSSAMSSISNSSQKSSFGSADVIIEIKWGEEFLRQRLKLLEEKTKSKIEIDGYSFTNIIFDERNSFIPPKDGPTIVPEDKQLFEASYRTTNILVYSTRSSRQLNGYRCSSNSFDPSESSFLETTAFRQDTFVPDFDATLIPPKRLNYSISKK